MIDMTTTVAPKSDQMNADDLIGRTRTIRVSRVAIAAGDDQPVSIYFDDDDGKPFKPCKSMRRVLINAWGGDGHAYVGRRMTLHRDDKVQFGGMAVGGIRISHLSDIPRDVTMALTDKRGSRKPYVVKPLPKDDVGPDSRNDPVDHAEVARLTALGDSEAARGTDVLRAFWGSLVPAMKKAIGGAPQLAIWQARAAEVITTAPQDDTPADPSPEDERDPPESPREALMAEIRMKLTDGVALNVILNGLGDRRDLIDDQDVRALKADADRLAGQARGRRG